MGFIQLSISTITFFFSNRVVHVLQVNACMHSFKIIKHVTIKKLKNTFSNKNKNAVRTALKK